MLEVVPGSIRGYDAGHPVNQRGLGPRSVKSEGRRRAHDRSLVCPSDPMTNRILR